MALQQTKAMTLVNGVAQDTKVDEYTLTIRADPNNPIQVFLQMTPNGESDTEFGLIGSVIPAGELWISAEKLPRGNLKVTGGSAYVVLRY